MCQRMGVQLTHLGTLAALMGRTSSISQWESRMEGKLMHVSAVSPITHTIMFPIFLFQQFWPEDFLYDAVVLYICFAFWEFCQPYLLHPPRPAQPPPLVRAQPPAPPRLLRERRTRDINSVSCSLGLWQAKQCATNMENCTYPLPAPWRNMRIIK